MKKLALINGIFPDVGEDLPIEFARAGFEVCLIGENSCFIKRIVANVFSERSIEEEIVYSTFQQNQLDVSKRTFDVVLNCGDFAIKGLKEKQDHEDELSRLSKHFFTICKVTRAVLPKMRHARSGKIFNLIPSPRGEALRIYVSAITAFSTLLKTELKDSGVEVILIAQEPNSVRLGSLKGGSDATLGSLSAREICKLAVKPHSGAEYQFR